MPASSLYPLPSYPPAGCIVSRSHAHVITIAFTEYSWFNGFHTICATFAIFSFASAALFNSCIYNFFFFTQKSKSDSKLFSTYQPVFTIYPHATSRPSIPRDCKCSLRILNSSSAPRSRQMSLHSSVPVRIFAPHGKAGTDFSSGYVNPFLEAIEKHFPLRCN